MPTKAVADKIEHLCDDEEPRVFVAAVMPVEEEDYITVVDAANGRIIFKSDYTAIKLAEARNTIRTYFARKKQL